MQEIRRAKVSQGLLSGKTYQQIARELEVTPATVSADVRKVMQRIEDRQYRSIREWRTLENWRLETMLVALWPLAVPLDEHGKPKNGAKLDLAAMDRILKIMDRRAKMLGLDALDGEKIALFQRLITALEEHGIKPVEFIDVTLKQIASGGIDG